MTAPALDTTLPALLANVADPLTEPMTHAMRIVHPYLNIQGCPWCPQPEQCRLCDKPREQCEDWPGHGDMYRNSETRIRQAAA